METFEIDILNPEAKKLLENLADLNLIKIRRAKTSDFSALVTALRSKSTENLSLEEIAKEVEDVRKSRYEK